MKNNKLKIIIPFFIAMILLLISVVFSQDESYISNIGVSIKETALGDMTADAISNSTGIPIAFIPAGSMKEVNIPVNEISSVNLSAFLQYPDDIIVTRSISGSAIKGALERSVSLYPQKNNGFLQISGVKFKFNPKAQKGNRITSILINNTKIDNAKLYTVAMPQPLANGAHGYFTIWGKSSSNVKETQIDIRNAISKYFKNVDVAKYKKLDRIISE